AVNNRPPDGEKTRLSIAAVCPRSTWPSSPVVTSQIRAVASSPAEASLFPSGLNTAWDRSSPTCARRMRCSCPVLASHNRIVPSRLVEASRLPSGLKITDRIAAVCPLGLRIAFFVSRSQTLISPASRHSSVAFQDLLVETSLLPSG